jgi:hypothetical protein
LVTEAALEAAREAEAREAEARAAEARERAAREEAAAREAVLQQEAAEREAAARAEAAAREETARLAREREREAQAKARRDALTTLQQLVRRVDALAQSPDPSIKAVDRALRDIRTALSSVPPLPSRQDFLDVTQHLKAAQATLQSKLAELREADEWQRWANATIQEQLCVKMEALQSLDDAEQIAREVKDLQRQWREAADVPRAQADALWRRFKTGHDVVWARCEAHFAARADTLRQNLLRKTALCEKAEALAESSNWLQTADEIKRLQAEWKSIGPVPRGQEKAIWERFRTPCDRFFTRRIEDLTKRKAVWAGNLEKKTALCEKAEQLAVSTDWDPAAAELKRLQAQWKAIGPVKKSRSEAIWRRFRAACDQFFINYANRHEAARAERMAGWEAMCAELEQLSTDGPPAGAPATDFVARVRSVHGRWKHEGGGRGNSPEARQLEGRFAAAFTQILAKWPDAIRNTDLDPDANRARMEALVKRMDELARSVTGGRNPGGADGDAALSPTTRLAAMLKEALASNTIGGGAAAVDEQARRAAVIEEVRQLQASWMRIGPVPDADRLPLQERFQRLGRLVQEGVRPTSDPTTRSRAPGRR